MGMGIACVSVELIDPSSPIALYPYDPCCPILYHGSLDALHCPYTTGIYCILLRQYTRDLLLGYLTAILYRDLYTRTIDGLPILLMIYRIHITRTITALKGAIPLGYLTAYLLPILHTIQGCITKDLYTLGHMTVL